MPNYNSNNNEELSIEQFTSFVSNIDLKMIKEFNYDQLSNNEGIIEAITKSGIHDFPILIYGTKRDTSEAKDEAMVDTKKHTHAKYILWDRTKYVILNTMKYDQGVSIVIEARENCHDGIYEFSLVNIRNMIIAESYHLPKEIYQVKHGSNLDKKKNYDGHLIVDLTPDTVISFANQLFKEDISTIYKTEIVSLSSAARQITSSNNTEPPDTLEEDTRIYKPGKKKK